MSFIKRGLVVAAGTAALLVPLATALPAEAASTAATACVLQGNAPATVNLVGGQTLANPGTYSFTNGLAFDCVIDAQVATAPAGQSIDIESLNVASSGTFVNIVCGTGGVHSTDLQNSSPTQGTFPGGGSSPIVITGNNSGLWTSTAFNSPGSHLGYDLTFAAGQGLLSFNEDGLGVVSGAGVISIQATSPQTDGVTCTKGFNVVGAVVGGANLPVPIPDIAGTINHTLGTGP